MASSSSSALLFLILAVVYAATGALAATFQVGDNQMWSIPSSSSYYTDWANGQTFAVGDSLVFNFNTGAHDVLEVTRANYDACTTSNPIMTHNTGPATVELTAAGTRYFICGVNGHCTASTPSGTPPPPPSSGAPTPPTTVATPGPSGSTPGARSAAPSASLGTAAVAATFALTTIAAALML
ncbi:unnamed protein product [Spirodela intermedia]|uniref:Phytocyanin domain-containing protein n=1 Tax=Spirodela intermedia TaxID=51605 RepID=A0A7I8JJM8_SPIIN|nr:unnamed protein product [Spirodela intermedia]CAA6670387.1 unnamed protein product [Spirodela intermedia]